jgi:hypothetical protein
MRRSPARIALAVAFVLLALNALGQVVAVPLGHSSDPPVLIALQAVIGVAGLVAAWATWTAARWAPVAALGFGLASAGMLVALPSLLGLEAEARSGIWTGAAAVFVFSVFSAWYLRRVTHSVVG